MKKNILLSLLTIVLFYGCSNEDKTNKKTVITSKSNISLTNNYNRIPLFFESNDGQFRKDVKYHANGHGYSLFLTNSEAFFRLKKINGDESIQNIVSMKFLDFNPGIKIVGLNKLQGKSNYYIGNDPSNWHANISHYHKVRYENIYSGIDLIFYGNNNNIEFDFVIHPGGDFEEIKFKINGIDELKLDKNKNLVLSIGTDSIIFRRPGVYQSLNNKIDYVTGEYRIDLNNEVHFNVADYNPLLALVIDPVVSYASYLGGSMTDEAKGIALDTEKNIYITGNTYSSDFPISGALVGVAEGTNILVTKISADGQSIIYSTILGGRYGDRSADIQVGRLGSAYICGSSSSYDDLSTTEINEGFPIINGFRDDISDHYSTDALAFKLKSDGNLVYSTFLGAPDEDKADVLAIDSDSCMYLIGTTLASIGSPNFPIKNAFQPNRGGYDYDGFVAKIDPSQAGDASLIYSTFLGATGDDILNDIAVDKNGNAIIVGRVWGNNFPLVNAMYTTKKGDYDAFVTKLNSKGNQAVFSTYIGGDENDAAYQVEVDNYTSIYVEGSGSKNFPTTNDPIGGDTEYGQFILKMNPNGQSLEYSTLFFLINIDAIKVKEDGSATLLLNESKFDPEAGKYIFVRSTATLNSTGTEVIDKSEIIGIDYTQLNNINNLLDDSGNLYLVSSSTSPDLYTLNPIQENNNGWNDIYIAITKPSGDILIVNSIGDSPDENPYELPCSTGESILRDGKEEPEVTLRAAIETANAMHLFKTVTIKFDIPDNLQPAIKVGSELPSIEVPVIINGTTQPQSNNIEIDGSLVDYLSEADGIKINSNDVTIRGLTIHSFPEFGINILGGSGHKIIRNKIGFDHTGINLKINASGAIKVQGDARDCIIGADEEELDMNYIGGGVLLVGLEVEKIKILKNLFEIPVDGDELPIDLSLDEEGDWDGPTACDWNIPQTGPNNLIPPPRILSTSESMIKGLTKPNSRIILYKVEEVGKDHKRYFARRAKPVGDWLSDFDGKFEMPVLLDLYTEIAAAVIDNNGNTSELSQIKRPLIFLPGEAGSWLRNGEGRNLWPPFESLASTDKEWNDNLLRLSIDEAGNDIYGKVKPYRILENFLGNDLGYASFLKKIEEFYPGHVDNNNPESLDLWRMSYDWRKSPYKIADSLKKMIDKLTSTEGESAWSTEVDIAAHSLGGLVASAYVRKYPEHSKKHLHRLVSMGTPYFGTPQTAAIHTKGYLFGLNDNRVVISTFDPDWGSIIKMFRNFPSAYTLLPSKAYFNSWEYIYYLKNLNNRTLWSWDKTKWFWADKKKALYGLDRNLNLLEGEQKLHDIIDDWRYWEGPPQIYRLYGRFGNGTAVAWEYDHPFAIFEPWVDPTIKEEGDLPQIVEYRSYLVPILGRGDGTVTEESATLGNKHWHAGDGNYGIDYSGIDESIWIEESEVFLCSHMGMVTQECDELSYRLLEILASGYRIVSEGNSMNRVGKTASGNEESSDIFYVIGSKPICVSVEDEDGLFVGPVSPDTPNKIEYGLPDVGYWSTEYNTTISLPQDKSYDLTITAQNDNTIINVKRLIAHESNRDNILFNDQPLDKNGELYFSLLSGGTDVNVGFLADIDGDGSYDSNLDPAAKLISTSLAPAIPKPEPFYLEADILKSDTSNKAVVFNLADVGGPIWQWKLMGNSNWILPKSYSGATPASVTLELETSSLEEGIYIDTMTVQLSIDEYIRNSLLIVQLIVRENPPELTDIIIEPSEVQLVSGQSFKFSAAGYDELEIPYQFKPLWSATGGLIDSSGMYIAGDNIGSYSVRAENEDGSIYDEAIIEISNVLDVDLTDKSIPKNYELYQNYPNPFNPITKIQYSIPLKAKNQKPKVNNITLKIYDVLGKEVAIILDQKQMPGIYEVEFDASEFPSGIYFYRIKVGDYIATKKMILLK